ncbi:MAG: hypothetical protein MZU91_12070 [Desulfosudis oleivorans]|nr:hypothetical protein [Desulfosudis oleivorans]
MLGGRRPRPWHATCRSATSIPARRSCGPNSRYNRRQRLHHRELLAVQSTQFAVIVKTARRKAARSTTTLVEADRAGLGSCSSCPACRRRCRWPTPCKRRHRRRPTRAARSGTTLAAQPGRAELRRAAGRASATRTCSTPSAR